MYSRRTFLKISAFLGALLAGSLLIRGKSSNTVRHILPAATQDKIVISVSLYEPASELEVMLDSKRSIKEPGLTDKGTNWQIRIENLQANKSYELELFSDHQSIFEPWKLKTFPESEAEIEEASFMAFTCPGAETVLGHLAENFLNHFHLDVRSSRKAFLKNRILLLP